MLDASIAVWDAKRDSAAVAGRLALEAVELPAEEAGLLGSSAGIDPTTSGTCPTTSKTGCC